MDFTAGIHSQYFSLSNSFSYVEPRLGWKLKMNKGQAVFSGAVIHSSTQPLYTYTYHKLDNDGNRIYHNKNMDFSRSLHTGIGYEKAFEKGFNIRSEVYYQYLYNIPVTVAPSSFSLINMGGGFARFFPDSLKNTGTGHNYGIELTVQKFFDKSFFFLFSGCLYDSKYTGSDGVLRNTSYNGSYVTNFLAGKEFTLNSKQTISLGMKVTMAGGKRYGYAESVLSSLYNEVNFKNPSADPFAEKQQLGFLPIFYYKFDFRLAKKGV